NNIMNNSSNGISYTGSAAAGGKIENNVITGNSIGVEYDLPGGDLGSSPPGSAGGNVLSCNTRNDLWSTFSGTISAQNNKWDHVPLTTSCTVPGADFCNNSGTTTLTTTGAAVVAG